MPRTTHRSFQYSRGQLPVVQGQLHFRRSFSNLFLTLTDVQGRILHSVSAGAVSPGNKRGKKSAEVLTLMVDKIVSFLLRRRMKVLEIISTHKTNWQILLLSTLIQEKARVAVVEIKRKWCVPHNGVRQRKARRV